MQLSNAPSQLVLPFANSGQKNNIPVQSQIGITPGAASYTDGFPPLTMMAVSAGGVPPSGLDFNGLLYEMSSTDVWFNAGGGFPYNSAFATAVGGYPKGARVLRADGSAYWFNTVDSNMSNPDTGGAGWIVDGGRPTSSVYASAQQTLAVGSSKVIFDSVEFDSGLWNATNHRFAAPFSGKYRINGAVLLSAPGSQSFAALILRNGTLVKQPFAFPQVSDEDISIPFEAIVSCATGDFIEVNLNVTQSSVLAGKVGSNQAFVFAQLEYLG